jgi:hypothetical protein
MLDTMKQALLRHEAVGLLAGARDNLPDQLHSNGRKVLDQSKSA